MLPRWEPLFGKDLAWLGSSPEITSGNFVLCKAFRLTERLPSDVLCMVSVSRLVSRFVAVGAVKVMP